MYDKVSTDLKFVDREKQVLTFWKEDHVFEKSVELRKGAPAYTVFDGPPTANGRPHIGHVLTRSIKDIIPRYRTMKGYDVLRKAGWDTHGLPVELEVEKELHLDGKEQIEAYGVEPFIEGCKRSVWKYKSEWEDMSDRVGFWMDMDDPYVTYHDDYIESEWWALKTIYDKGLLYKGYKIVPYCPPLRDGPLLPRGGPGLQGREGDLRHRQVLPEGRQRHLHPRLDHHPLDAAQQRSFVRQRP